ncbi:MAG: hypothetical protein C0404_08705 [Verrucomicrobia bacterium]|nr:hypothetical protein [Verrucomicrobiota bacterium]
MGHCLQRRESQRKSAGRILRREQDEMLTGCRKGDGIRRLALERFGAHCLLIDQDKTEKT